VKEVVLGPETGFRAAENSRKQEPLTNREEEGRMSSPRQPWDEPYGSLEIDTLLSGVTGSRQPVPPMKESSEPRPRFLNGAHNATNASVRASSREEYIIDRVCAPVSQGRNGRAVTCQKGFLRNSTSRTLFHLSNKTARRIGRLQPTASLASRRLTLIVEPQVGATMCIALDLRPLYDE